MDIIKTMNDIIYFDNSATTIPYNEAIDYQCLISKSIYGNPSSLHNLGISAEKCIKNARNILAKSLDVEPSEIFFTSGGTESNNLAIRGYLKSNSNKGKHIITSMIEHPSVLEIFSHYSKNNYSVDFISVDKNGLIDLDKLEARIDSHTSLISIMYINNEVGIIQPIEEVIKIKNKVNKNTVVHVDAVQAFGKIAIKPSRLGIDMLSISAHKVHGPKGIGCLFVRKGLKIHPLLLGGGQESNIRSGTENVGGIAGFGKAIELLNKQDTIQERFEFVLGLKNYFIKRLESEIQDLIIISSEKASPYILNVSFKNIRAEVLLHHLEEKNIYVSTGSACSSKKKIHSHVLKAMGVKPSDIEGAIRFSFSHMNTFKEVDIAIDAIKAILPRISK